MKRTATWNRLNEQMTERRMRPDPRGNPKMKKTTVPHELTVQRLASEPDNKQTFKPVQPREFVYFPYNELTLSNLKKACADHFNFRPSACDVLVSNKGPSCTKIEQIPHRKDKVYLMRFVLEQDNGEDEDSGNFSRSKGGLQGLESRCSFSSRQNHSEPAAKQKPKASYNNFSMTTQFPQSVSIASLMEAGKLVKPESKKKVTLTVEQFDLASKGWKESMEIDCTVEDNKFASGGFRDAYNCIVSDKSARQHSIPNRWVLKTYQENGKELITKCNSTIEGHCRKQVQMHEVARHLTKKFEEKAPPEMGRCFHYNRIFYVEFNGEPATLEEFVQGSFGKLINNDGNRANLPQDSDHELKALFEKAECLVHYTYETSAKKLMLLDIQGSGYSLYDPEIATDAIMDGTSNEFYFCVGNCSSVGIAGFLSGHKCNPFCEMMGLDK